MRGIAYDTFLKHPILRYYANLTFRVFDICDTSNNFFKSLSKLRN